MKTISLEKFVNEHQLNVYPITIMKLLLNKAKILNYVNRPIDVNSEIKNYFKIDNSDCEYCKTKQREGISTCRQHTSIDRVLNQAKRVFWDQDTNLYIYKNEVFRQVDEDKFVIIYCPHTKPIEKITDNAVRKINPMTVIDDNFNLPNYETIPILSTSLMEQYTECWFNQTFSIVSIPKDRGKCDFVLRTNK